MSQSSFHSGRHDSGLRGSRFFDLPMDAVSILVLNAWCMPHRGQDRLEVISVMNDCLCRWQDDRCCLFAVAAACAGVWSSNAQHSTIPRALRHVLCVVRCHTRFSTPGFLPSPSICCRAGILSVHARVGDQAVSTCKRSAFTCPRLVVLKKSKMQCFWCGNQL